MRGIVAGMTGITQVLSAMDTGDPYAAQQLLPLVYDELRGFTEQQLAHEKPGQTLPAVALVHDALVRLVDTEGVKQWTNRGHFFAAAAEAIRRILVEHARGKQPIKHADQLHRINLDEPLCSVEPRAGDLCALDEALDRLDAIDAPAAALVKLRYFAGLSMEEAADALGVSLATAEKNWAFARTWLHREIWELENADQELGGEG